MTSHAARSCPSCAAELAPDAAFCPACGTPAPPTGPSDHTAFRRPAGETTSPPPNAPPPPPRSLLPPPLPPLPPRVDDVVEAGPVGPVRRPRRRQTIGVLVALAVLAALAVGGVVASTWGEPDSEVFGYGGHLALPAAIAEKPDREWTWQISGSLTGLTAAGDTTYAATDDGEVTALDGDGHETWTAEVGDGGFLAASPDHDELVILDDVEQSTVTALSSDDGTELWSADGDAQWFEDDRLFVASEAELAAYDLGSGDRVWSVSAQQIGVGEAGIFVLDGGELRRVDGADGHTIWSVDVVRSLSETSDIAVADDFVVVGGPQAVAFDADDGSTLWSSHGTDGPEVTLFARDEVTVQPVASSGRDDDVPLYDRDGRDGSVRTSSYLVLVPIRSGSEEYAFNFATGELYGDGHEVVETYDGTPALAAEGLYVQNDGTVSYYEYGAADPAWTLDEDLSDNASLQTGEGRLLVADRGELTSYR